MTPEELSLWEPFLKRNLVFGELASEDLNKLAQRLKPLSLPKGSLLFKQGEKGDTFYLITSGQVRVLMQTGLQERVVAYLSRGDSLGETSLLTGQPHSTTVRLDTTAEFLALAKKDFEEIVQDNPSILLHLSRILSHRLLAASRAREKDEARPSRPGLFAVVCALEPEDRLLFCSQLAISLIEQTRKKILLVDLTEPSGRIAEILGLKCVPTTEQMLREQDMRDPAVIENLILRHPSGLEMICLAPSVLAGRLFRAIFMFANMLRENYDYVLVCVGDNLSPVEKAILEQVDQVVEAGATGQKERTQYLHGTLQALLPGQGHKIHVWLTDAGSPPYPAEYESDKVPWSPLIREALAKGSSPFEAIAKYPKAQIGIDRVARHIAGLRIGLALGAGGALGYTMIGVWKVLNREHIHPDVIAGTSIGALIGAACASGLSPEVIEAIALKIDKAWVYESVFWDLSVPRSGFLPGTTLLRFLRSIFGQREFKDLEIPFTCVATDITTGELVFLRDGRVAEAVRASSGIPIVFKPFPYRGKFLVDGSLVEPLPTRALSSMGADILLAVNLSLPPEEKRKAARGPRAQIESLVPMTFRAPHMGDILFKTIYTMQYEISKSLLQLAHVLVQPDLRGFSWNEFHRAKELIEAGERACEEMLPKIKSFLPFFAGYCQMPIKRPTMRY